MPHMDQLTIDEMVKAYPQSVRLTEVKIRDRGEVKKLDAGDLHLKTGDRVLLEADGEVTYGVVYTAPYETPFIPPMRVLKPILRKANGEDAALVSRLERLSQEAMAYCRVKAAEMKLRLKLVEVYGALFAAVAANLAVVACARYEFALPLAADAGEAQASSDPGRIATRRDHLSVVNPAAGAEHPQASQAERRVGAVDIRADQLVLGQEVAHRDAHHRGAAQATADDHFPADLARLVLVQAKADVMHLHGGAVMRGTGHRDFELSREKREFRVERRPLPQQLAHRPWIGDLVGGSTRPVIGRHVADAVDLRVWRDGTDRRTDTICDGHVVDMYVLCAGSQI